MEIKWITSTCLESFKCIISIEEDFIIFLFDHHEKFEIKECQQVIFLLELMQGDISEHFLLWRFPEMLSNPVLYLDTLYYMNSKRHSIMRNFTTVYGHIDLMFDRFIPLLSVHSPISLSF